MAQVKKPHLKDKKHKDREETQDAEPEEERATQKITTQNDDEDVKPTEDEMKDTDMSVTDRHPHPRRVWSKKGMTTSQSLYAIASTPQRVTKAPNTTAESDDKKSKHKVEQEAQDLLQKMKDLSLQVKKDLEQLKSSGASSSEQISAQQETMLVQIQNLTDIANRHDDEIDDLRGMSNFTHEIVMEREQKENAFKMVIKSWPQEASYYDRVRVTDWLLQRAQVQSNTQQEHGYYGSGRKFILSPVTIITFQTADDHHAFEKYAYSTFSAKWPLYYRDAQGNCSQHWKGGWRKLIITNYISKMDLTINLALVTLLHILTAYDGTGFTGAGHLSHRPTDKQIFDLDSKKVVAKITYDKDRGVLTLVVPKNVIPILEKSWHEAWKVVHKDHPRYTSYNRYPYAVSFAQARLDDETQEQSSRE